MCEQAVKPWIKHFHSFSCPLHFLLKTHCDPVAIRITVTFSNTMWICLPKIVPDLKSCLQIAYLFLHSFHQTLQQVLIDITVLGSLNVAAKTSLNAQLLRTDCRRESAYEQKEIKLQNPSPDQTLVFGMKSVNTVSEL